MVHAVFVQVLALDRLTPDLKDTSNGYTVYVYLTILFID